MKGVIGVQTEIAPVDIQDCFKLVYELGMLHQWHILSLSTPILWQVHRQSKLADIGIAMGIAGTEVNPFHC
ncbi:hypothetical protein Scep_012455 [Stephania cephalantha]|uniref:Uncharacterized protein n=1 Tax=Stephania cephalantha TaxID=152367 RepID=A0AAP0JFL3_9MAGN